MIIWHNFRKITNDCTATLKRCLYPFVLFYCHTFPYFIDFRDCHFRFANDSWTSVRHTYKPPHQSAAITEYKYSSDAVRPIYAVSYHVATDKPPLPAQDVGKFRSIFSENLQPIATREKKARGTLLVD